MPLFQPSFQDEELEKKKARLFGIPSDLHLMDQGSPPGASPPILDPSVQGSQGMGQAGQATPPKLAESTEGPSLKQRLFGYSDPAQTDEYGLQKPTKAHEGILPTIAKYALPALTGLAGGVGLIPGLAAAYAGSERQGVKQNALDQANYNIARTQALASKRQEALDRVATGKLDLEQGKAPLEAAKTQAETNLANANAAKAGERGPLQSFVDWITKKSTGTKSGGTLSGTRAPRLPGATHTGKGSDGKMYQLDANGNILGAA